MILSASRRTDIPAFYGEWMMNRLRAGYLLVRNPYRHSQIHRIRLNPDVVDCIVFWTKDPEPFLPQLKELDQMGYRYYFQFTVTPYGKRIEPFLREKSRIVKTFRELSGRIGPERVCWRYDPILLDEEYTCERHQLEFEKLCQELSGFTDSVTISFLDLYRGLQKKGMRACTPLEMAQLAAIVSGCARSHGLTVLACCEEMDMTPYGIRRGSCIDAQRIQKICKAPLKAIRDSSQRTGCGCMQSTDIGAYNTCQNGCVYCYATTSAAAARKRYEAHNPAGEFLTGELLTGESIIDKPCVSLLVKDQMGLDLDGL